MRNAKTFAAALLLFSTAALAQSTHTETNLVGDLRKFDDNDCGPYVKNLDDAVRFGFLERLGSDNVVESIIHVIPKEDVRVKLNEKRNVPHVTFSFDAKMRATANLEMSTLDLQQAKCLFVKGNE